MDDNVQYAIPFMKPADFAKVTGIASPVVRDWRRLGLFDEPGYGLGTQQESGRWLYSYKDAVILCTINALRFTRNDIRLLIAIAHRINTGIMSKLGLHVLVDDGAYAVFWIDEDDDDGALLPPFSHEITNIFAKPEYFEGRYTFVLDLRRIANSFDMSLRYALHDMRDTHNAAIEAAR